MKFESENEAENANLKEMTPREIVRELDAHIVGQSEAKRAVAIAVRNRWRRRQLPEDLRREISPKNILMIGPTGVGKTELARRLARLTQAPFVKVEATKYTEVGYYGRDVESMVRELVENALKLVRERELEKVKKEAEKQVEERILDILVPLSSQKFMSLPQPELSEIKFGKLNRKNESESDADRAGENEVGEKPDGNSDGKSQDPERENQTGLKIGNALITSFHVDFPEDFPEELKESILGMFPGATSSTHSGDLDPFLQEAFLKKVSKEPELSSNVPECQGSETGSETDSETDPEEKLRQQGLQAAEEAKRRALEERERVRSRLRAGMIEDREIEIPGQKRQHPPFMMMQVSGNEMENGLSDLLGKMLPKKTVRRRLPIREARKILLDAECDQMLDEEKIQTIAVQLAEESGIIFLDEIDKIVASNTQHGADVSRQGVQRDLLPIMEGTTIHTRYGSVKTDHILFVAAGAFHQNKPGDLMPELQGRFPIRVELHDLSKDDFSRILKEPENALLRQYQALLEADGVHAEFTPDAVDALADYAWRVNQTSQNIGARRLCTILERLLEELSFDAPDLDEKTVRIDAGYVRERLEEIAQDEDLSRFIL